MDDTLRSNVAAPTIPPRDGNDVRFERSDYGRTIYLCGHCGRELPTESPDSRPTSSFCSAECKTLDADDSGRKTRMADAYARAGQELRRLGEVVGVSDTNPHLKQLLGARRRDAAADATAELQDLLDRLPEAARTIKNAILKSRSYTPQRRMRLIEELGQIEGDVRPGLRRRIRVQANLARRPAPGRKGGRPIRWGPAVVAKIQELIREIAEILRNADAPRPVSLAEEYVGWLCVRCRLVPHSTDPASIVRSQLDRNTERETRGSSS
jgi:hypothetical protein